MYLICVYDSPSFDDFDTPSLSYLCEDDDSYNLLTIKLLNEGKSWQAFEEFESCRAVQKGGSSRVLFATDYDN